MIKLNHGYQIEADERCYILSRTTKGRNKKGEETEYKRAVGYYSRLNTAISAYADELERQHIQDTDMTLEGMESGLFAYVAHPEIAWSNYPHLDDACLQMSETICTRAKELGIPLEYNLQGNSYRERGRYHGIGYPHDAFWRIAAQTGNQAIIGIDAHHADMLSWTDRFVRAREHLTQMGLEVLDSLGNML